MLAFRTLGAVDLRKDEMEISTVLAQPKRLALLAYLAAAKPRGFQSRDRLMALFWPEADEERARNSLRQALHHLRRSLGENAIPGRGEREVALDTALVKCDVVAFDEAIEGSRWEDALGLYQGEFMPGVFVQDAPEVEHWLEDERSRMRRSAVAAAWRLSERAEGVGDQAAAVEWARRATTLDPNDEHGVRRLLELLGRAGDDGGAIVVYEEFVRRLERGSGAAPAPETVQLATALRERVVARASGPVTLRPGVTSPPHATPARASLATASVRMRRVGPRWIPIATTAGALALVAAAFWYLGRGRDAGAPVTAVGEPTVAVLPFVNMSGDPANEYFSDGISEELLNLLAQVPGLQVAARTSSFTFKGKNAPVDSIARVLRVRHVLEGSVRQSGPTVRITAQLIDARTGYHLWSGTFDRKLEDVFAVQDSIGRVIVDVLRPRLTQGVASRAVQRREPANPEAHIAVLKGWRAFRQNTPEGWAAAATHFEEAIRSDSGYGKGWGGLATVRVWQANFRQREQAAGYAEAWTLARRALALDSTLSEAHVVLGFIAQTRDWDYEAAEAHYARAIAVNPSDTRGYSRRALMLANLGRGEEALASALRAVELDPASPAVYSDLANTYSRLDRHADAEAAQRSALALDPGHPILLGNLATNLVIQEKFAEALDVIRELRQRTPDDVSAAGRHAYILAQSGRSAEARAVLDSATARGLPRISRAVTHHVLNDTARVIQLVLEAARHRDQELQELLDETQFTKVRKDPRIQRVIAQVRGSQPQQSGRPR